MKESISLSTSTTTDDIKELTEENLLSYIEWQPEYIQINKQAPLV